MRQIGFTEIAWMENGQIVLRDGGCINLAECAANWAMAHPVQYPTPAQCRCVGERWASSHFVLHAAERIVLVNDVPLGSAQRLLDLLHIPLRLDTRRYTRFREVQQMLLDAGWTTCDMT